MYSSAVVVLKVIAVTLWAVTQSRQSQATKLRPFHCYIVPNQKFWVFDFPAEMTK